MLAETEIHAFCRAAAHFRPLVCHFPPLSMSKITPPANPTHPSPRPARSIFASFFKRTAPVCVQTEIDMATVIFLIVMLHLVAGFGYVMYKLNKKPDTKA